MAPTAELHVSEPVACLALATDLGMGQPLEQGLRTCLLAVRVGERLGLGVDELADAYYIALLRFAGCNAHARQDALETGDEIAFRAGIAPVLNGGNAQMLRFMVTQAGAGSPAAARLKMVAAALAAGSKGARQAIAATCEAAQMIAARLGMSAGVVEGLEFTFEHHDGSGLPQGVSGEQIPVAAHLAMVARDFELLYRLGGRDLVLEEAHRRRGRAYDPKLLDGFVAFGLELLESPKPEAGWEAVIAADPRPRVLSGDKLTDAFECFADFSDIRSPFTHGYSHRIRDLVAAAAAESGGGSRDVLAAAALVQELGMTAVPSAVVEKPGSLGEGEWERVRLHPYFTERILARSPGLAPIGAIAGGHHERLDGSGYHRGSTAPQIPREARLLAAAGAYAAMLSARPWRPALSPGTAVSTLREMAGSGALDSDAVEAVLAAAGEPVVARRRTWPAGLTDREVEVLRLIGRGMSNRQVAQQLVISTKTVGRHVENIYAKAGVSTRAAATMFALQHGLTYPEQDDDKM